MPVLLDSHLCSTEIKTTETLVLANRYSPFEAYELDSSRIGPWTDIYSLGAILYRCVNTETPIDVTKRVLASLHNEPDPLTPIPKKIRKSYSVDFIEGIEWALQVEEKKRPQSIQEWREKLLASDLNSERRLNCRHSAAKNQFPAYKSR